MTRHPMVFLFTALLMLGCIEVFAQEKQRAMSNADVVKMVQSGVSESAIISAIRKATPNFELTDEGVIVLKEQKVPDAVILAMMRRQGFTPPPPKPKPQPQPASREASGPKWEFEIHGGIGGTQLTGGWTELPAADSYSLAGSGAQGYSSIRVSSWYYGDGAALLGLSSSLDPVIKKSLVKPDDKSYGFRFSRSISKVFSAEFNFERGGKLSIPKDTLAQVEAVRSAFVQEWNRLNVPGNSRPTSVRTISDNGGHQLFTTGAILVKLPAGKRVQPYVTAGAGMVFNGSGKSSVTLTGSYGGPNALETDTVRLSFSQSSNHAVTGLVGAGVKVMLTRHLGVRLDGRAYFYQNTSATLLSADHTNTSGAGWVVNATGYSVPFLQRLSGPGMQAYSTLSGPAISGVRTFFGSGIERQVPVTVGLFWRF